MKLEKKLDLAARTLKAGKDRIVFNPERLAEIKQAITRQDIRDLQLSNAIFIKEKKGRRKLQVRKTRRRAGKIRRKIKDNKKHYIQRIRKFRAYLKQLKIKNQISRDLYYRLRKEIRTAQFKDLTRLKEHIKELK